MPGFSKTDFIVFYVRIYTRNIHQVCGIFKCVCTIKTNDTKVLHYNNLICTETYTLILF